MCDGVSDGHRAGLAPKAIPMIVNAILCITLSFTLITVAAAFGITGGPPPREPVTVTCDAPFANFPSTKGRSP